MKVQLKRVLWMLICLIVSNHSFSQNRWHPYAGLHISGDAEMFYIGPSFQAGMDFQLKKKLLLTSYLFFFQKKVRHFYPFENGKFKTITFATLIQVNTGKKTSRSFFIAGGVCLQKWMDKFIGAYQSWDLQRMTFIPAFRMGYFFAVGKNRITVELNASGPYSYHDEFGENFIELVTQISFGTRFIF